MGGKSYENKILKKRGINHKYKRRIGPFRRQKDFGIAANYYICELEYWPVNFEGLRTLVDLRINPKINK